MKAEVGEDVSLLKWFRKLIWGQRFWDPYAPCDHDWQVVCLITSEIALQTQCKRCSLYGSVSDPTEEEWAKGFGAPSNPYDWLEPQRVETPFATIGDWLDARKANGAK